MKHIQPDTLHFYAASAATWMTTKPDLDLVTMLKRMAKEGRVFNLFMVPLPWDAGYEIKAYRPVVDGAVWLGCFDPMEKL